MNHIANIPLRWNFRKHSESGILVEIYNPKHAKKKKN